MLPAPPSTAAREPAARAQLEQAFHVFNQASEHLAESYHDLEREVAQLTAELARARRLAAMGEMAANLAHQLRTPLATALLYVSQLGAAGLAEPERCRYAERALARLRHLERLIGDMLRLARGAGAPRESVLVAQLLAEARQVIEPQLGRRGIGFRLRDDARGARVSGDREALAGAVMNLLENALQACAAGDSVELAAEADAACCTVTVADGGCGIAPQALARLFEPFFTTRADGTGLGLAIARSVARAHGGDVVARANAGRGATFVLSLPLAAAADGGGAARRGVRPAVASRESPGDA
jgi:two-component system sensor histidine kinase FlrB